MKKGVLILASVLAAAAVYIAYTQISLDVYKVKVDTMKVGDIKISLDLTGEVKPQNESDIKTVGGQIREVYVSAGDSVQVGDTLFSYDTADAQKQLDSAQKVLDSLQSQQKTRSA
ncbi:MAG: biotin/lipoyl-binding protein [Eubacteriales bacterium]